jgi:hypothetical protein
MSLSHASGVDLWCGGEHAWHGSRGHHGDNVALPCCCSSRGHEHLGHV